MNIIITGASGLIGSNLTKLLKQNHFSVTKLTTNPKLVNDKDTFLWHPDKGYIDTRCFKEENIIINLAGANIFDKRWTDQRKKELTDSRIEGTSLLFDMINKEGFNVKRLINASAIGIYPDPCGPSIKEDQPHGDSFISDLCIKWEAAAHLFDTANIPVTIIRIGIVLDAEKGFLEALAKPIKMNAGAVLGSGKQFVSWIHIDDLVSVFFEAVKENITGIYNAVAPHPLTMEELTNKVAKILGKKIWLPKVPIGLLKIGLGERANLIGSDQHISCEKLTASGFQFKFPIADDALANLLSK